MDCATEGSGGRFGVLGGTFDPPHIGHLVPALRAREELRLDRVLMIPAGDPWQKRGRRVTESGRRLEMLRAAVDGLAGLVVDDREVRRSGPTYTIDTIDALAKESPGAQPWLILGADQARSLDTWHRVDELRASTALAIASRPGYGDGDVGRLVDAGWRAEPLTVPLLEVSSTELRRRCAVGASIDVVCPAAVVSLIAEWSLYDGANGS